MNVNRERPPDLPFPPIHLCFPEGSAENEVERSKGRDTEVSGEESPYLAYDVNDS